MSTSSGQPTVSAVSVRRRGLLILAASLAAMVLARGAVPDGTGDGPGPKLAVDVNTAPEGVLEALPRIGPALAGRIVEARRRSPIADIDDLDRRVRGIGPATVEALRPFLRFDARPASPDSPDR